jgi:hypothetical protein
MCVCACRAGWQQKIVTGVDKYVNATPLALISSGSAWMCLSGSEVSRCCCCDVCYCWLQVRVTLRSMQEGLPGFQAAWNAWAARDELPVRTVNLTSLVKFHPREGRGAWIRVCGVYYQAVSALVPAACRAAAAQSARQDLCHTAA